MARARNIKPGFFANEELAECSFEARLLFAGLWTLADRKGRLADRPKRIKAQLFPYDDVDAEKLIQELAARGFVRRYAVGDLKLIDIPSFERNQNPHHTEKQSTLPAYQENNGEITVKGAEEHRLNRADSLIHRFTDSLIPESPHSPPGGTPGKHSDTGEPGYSAAFELWWKSYPAIRRTQKRKAQAAWSRACKRVAKDRGMRQTEAQAFLLERSVDFAASPKGRSQFAPNPAPWLNGACYDDEPEAWQLGDDRPNGDPVQQQVLTLEELKSWRP